MSSSTLRFEADRIGTIVMYVGALIGAVILVPLSGFITQKLTTNTHMILAGAATAVVGSFMVYRQLRYVRLEWIELDDQCLTVAINKETYQIAWDAMTQVVQNYDPVEVWYIYTNDPRPSLAFDPGTLSVKDLKAMREFIKARVGYTTESDPAYVTRHYK